MFSHAPTMPFVSASLCKELLAAGAPGLHFYTMNSSTATQEIYRKLNDAK